MENKEDKLAKELALKKLAGDESSLSATESFLRGGAQGATMGWGDELSAALSALLPTATDRELNRSYSDRYELSKNQLRKENEEAEEANPGSYMGGQIAGGITTSAVPTGLALKSASTAAKVANLGTGILGGIALDAAGQSKEENVLGRVSDAASNIKDTGFALYDLATENPKGAAMAAILTPVFIKSPKTGKLITKYKLDPEKLGYKFEVKDSFGHPSVNIYNRQGKKIGNVSAQTHPNPKTGMPETRSKGTKIETEYQGKGLGPRAYQLLKESGYNMKPDEDQSDSGRAMWEQLKKWYLKDEGYRPEKSVKEKFLKKLNFYNLNDDISEDDFLYALNRARELSPNVKKYTTQYNSPEEIKDFKRFLTPEEDAGFMIKPDGELTGLFKSPDSLRKDIGPDLVEAAKKAGATKGDYFDSPKLKEIYENAGFKEYKRVPNYEKGGPDVVYMALPDKHPQLFKKK